MINEKQIRQALSVIIDPDFKKDIVSLGFVKNLKIDGGHVSFDIELTTPACPVKSEFEQRAQEVVSHLEGVQSVRVNMTSKPVSSTATLGQVPDSSLKDIGAIIAISSCKGGVGKSTVAACLALELAGRGHNVGLLDCDVYGPSLPTLFNLHRPRIYTNERQQVKPVEVNGLKLMSFGFLLGDAPAVLRGPLVSRYVQQLLHATAWGPLDYLFIDLPPGTGDTQLTITQTVRLSGSVIVTTPQTLSLVDVARGILMFEKVQAPMLGVIENMAYFECDACHKQHNIFGKAGGGDIEERFGLKTLATLPLLPELSAHLTDNYRIPAVTEAVNQVVMAIGRNTIAQQQIPQMHSDDNKLTLIWPDGLKTEVSHFDLRLSCRCAVCVDEISGEARLKRSDIPRDVKPKKIIPLGNYALGIEWSDGHSSGIYPYKNIREISRAIMAG